MILPARLFQKMSRAPRPFPGRYPTRVRIEAVGLLPFKYEGKPVPELLKTFQRNFFVKRGEIHRVSFCEVDQNGLVRYQCYGDPPVQVGFADLYYPFFPRWSEASRWATMFALLDRELIEVDGRRGYECSFMNGCPMRDKLNVMLRAFIKGKLKDDWLREGEQEILIEFLNKKAQAFSDSVFGIEQKQRVQYLNRQIRARIRENLPADPFLRPPQRPDRRMNPPALSRVIAAPTQPGTTPDAWTVTNNATALDLEQIRAATQILQGRDQTTLTTNHNITFTGQILGFDTLGHGWGTTG